MEALASLAKTLCFRGHLIRASKNFLIGGNSNRQQGNPQRTPKLHPSEKYTLDSIEDYSCEAFQIVEAKVLLQLQSFSNFRRFIKVS